MRGILRLIFAATVIIVFGFSDAHAQVNSWTKPTSGYWEELFWSLGVRPASDHSIMFTNEGWKALAIGPTTVRDFPSTMRVTRLTVLSPTNSFNTLLLNYAGVQTPLRVAENFHLGSNSVLLSLASGLQVSNVFRIDGTVNHGDFSEVSARIVFAGSNSPGAYNLSNGVFNVRDYMFVGYTAPATFTQHGGVNNSAQLRFRAGGQYLLRGGEVAADSMIIGDQSAGSFEQSGGQVTATNRVRLGGELATGQFSTTGFGQYTLSSGTLRTPLLAVGRPNDRFSQGGHGIFNQSGGSVAAGGIEVSGNRREATYNLIAGDLATTNSTVAGGGAFLQAGGLHSVSGPLAVGGHYERGFEAIYAGYTLSNGIVRAQSLNVGIGTVSQAGGTNDIAGNLVLAMEGAARSSYHLGGGRLNTYNTLVYPSFNGGFSQSGGVHTILGRLDLLGPAARLTIGPSVPVFYTLSGGQLIVDNIRVLTNAIFRHTGGAIDQSGSLTLAGGNWESASGTHQLGLLLLGPAPTNSSLTLPSSTTTLRFANGGLAAWASDARLIIQNWRGTPSGGGMHRVIFGTSASGLGPQLLAQIRFRDPAGFPAGDHGARILSTGEIVPVPRPPVSYSRNGSQLVFQWPTGWTLQTATNISGPFTDVNAASNRYTNSTASDPQRYFRLRQ